MGYYVGIDLDGLMDVGYRVHHANPSAIKQYEGLKYTDDTWDSFWLAHLLRLRILPEGHIYPKEIRPIRDLLRKRLMLVHHKTAHILSMQSMVSRNNGIQMDGNAIKTMKAKELSGLFSDEHLLMSASCNHQMINFLSKQIVKIEITDAGKGDTSSLLYIFLMRNARLTIMNWVIK